MKEGNIIIELNTVHNLDAITFMEQLYKDYGDESINMFLCDLPYTFKGKQRVTANKWDLPVDDNRFFELALQMLTPDGCIALTATNPFASYLVMNHLDCFKYEWIWEKDNGSNFVHVKHQPFKVHEQVLIFGKAPTTYNKAEKYMTYNPQMTEGKAYTVKSGNQISDNLATAKQIGGVVTASDGMRYPRSVIKVNSEHGLHPTQKPVKLFNELINTYTNKKDVVVDICCGSGTTAISAMDCCRDFIVNDFEIKYADITNTRVNEFKSKKYCGNCSYFGDCQYREYITE